MDVHSEKDMLEWIAAEIERMARVMSGLEEQVTAQKKEELSKTAQSATVDQQVHYFPPAPPFLHFISPLFLSFFLSLCYPPSLILFLLCFFLFFLLLFLSFSLPS